MENQLELQVWDGAQYERHVLGSDPLLLRQEYKRQQWMTQEAWQQAFPGRSRAFRIVETHRDRPLKLPRLRKQALTAAGGEITVEDQAARYVEWLSERYNPIDEVPVTLFQPSPSRRRYADRFNRALATEMSKLFAAWAYTYIDPDKYYHVEETQDAEAVPSDADR